MKEHWPPEPRILYAFQGTGNGHASRAAELVPLLKKYARVEVLCSGHNRQLSLDFPVDFQLNGISFSYNSKGGLSYLQTALKANFLRFKKEVKALDLSAYDLVLNDFEPVSAYAAKRQAVKLIALSHQASFLSENSPRPQGKHPIAEWIFKHYAPAKEAMAFHFKRYDNFIHPPVLRREIQDLESINMGHYLVYLPAYSDAVIRNILKQMSNKEWIVFSKECQKTYTDHNLRFEPIQGEAFLKYLATCEGLLCSAGFEAPAEALYLGKKLFVIPIKGQYEQFCNAAALEQMGVPVSKDLNARSLQLLQDWVYQENANPPLEVADPESLVLKLLEQEGLLKNRVLLA
ncbi:glycosyltransferase family protein [Croceimicrobium hydrocarbonivorans]|uniref:Glycosyl transferase n=1 Tax=Croceimicrobium hydrocarbonivorans TaxID=2761580 RepID=A0A7H0VEJ1_9FLAO|nr:glycosyltransferase family protein [Croceimicrobium hydrocarbonivorans]QNR24139.1 glycosyl transferase [Croceimicrobium hydrocarbonivorans]